jgi:hypothetical protein
MTKNKIGLATHTKNYWTDQIRFKTLNKKLAEKVKLHLGLNWTDGLKRAVTNLALQFIKDNNLDNSYEFAVVLEKIKGVDIFRGIKILH